jgi:hypothetical protein
MLIKIGARKMTKTHKKSDDSLLSLCQSYYSCKPTIQEIVLRIHESTGLSTHPKRSIIVEAEEHLDVSMVRY